MAHQKKITEEDFNGVDAELNAFQSEHNYITLKLSKSGDNFYSITEVKGLQEHKRKYVKQGIVYY